MVFDSLHVRLDRASDNPDPAQAGPAEEWDPKDSNAVFSGMLGQGVDMTTLCVSTGTRQQNTSNRVVVGTVVTVALLGAGWSLRSFNRRQGGFGRDPELHPLTGSKSHVKARGKGKLGR